MTAANPNCTMDDTPKYSYSKKVTWDEFIVTKEAVAFHMEIKYDEHEDLRKEIKEDLVPKLLGCRDHKRYRDDIYHGLRRARNVWIWRDHEQSNRRTKKLTVDAMLVCKQEHIKFLLYWCDPHKLKSTQRNTDIMIRCLLVQAMREYELDKGIQPKSGVRPNFPLAGIWKEDPISFPKILDMLLKVLEDITGDIVCILGDVQYLLLRNDANARKHKRFLATFFEKLSKRVRFCIVSETASPKMFSPLEDNFERGKWHLKDMRQ